MRLPTRQDGIENRNKVYTAWKNALKISSVAKFESW